MYNKGRWPLTSPAAFSENNQNVNNVNFFIIIRDEAICPADPVTWLIQTAEVLKSDSKGEASLKCEGYNIMLKAVDLSL